MNELSSEEHFYVQDGSVLKNVEELFEALQDMPNHVFEHHVNANKNDFHNWIKDVFQNHSLALNIKNCKDKDEMLKYVFMSLFG